MAFYFHIFPARPSAWWSERKKTFYLFFLNQGYFDQVYETMIIRPYLRFASWLWQSLDVRFIDRPASRLADASFRMATGFSRVVGVKKTGDDDPLYRRGEAVPHHASDQRFLRILLVLLVVLLVLVEGIELVFSLLMT
jgi:NADH:ubiquinone oxidoreductase subunit 5 (subunit L)/multisubunit Na+/H+ antiporter MnhA subunit